MAKQPLEGIHVADFTWLVVGPVVSRYLAHHGATVVHVESRTAYDVVRSVGPYAGGKPGLNRSGFFNNFNTGKLGLTLNLRDPKARPVVEKLVQWADVVVDNFTPGTMGRLGLGYDDLVKIRPDVIAIGASSAGQYGPNARLPAVGVGLAAMAGFGVLTGWPDRDPAVPYGAYTDMICPRFGAALVVAALDYRRRSGKGQFLDLAQLESAIQFLAPVMLDYTVNGRVEKRAGNRSSRACPHGAYRCKGQDRWCAIAVRNDEEWQALCQVMSNPGLATDARFATTLGRMEHETELDQLIESWTAGQSAEEVMYSLQAAGVPAGVVETNEDLFKDPQLQHRQHFWFLDHSETGRKAYDGPCFKMSSTPGEVTLPGPCIGEHTEYVCTQLLGLSDEEFVEYLAEGIFE
ncbi:MAG: CoA transferase [Chloroflexi bacterium]|nr:CoA transferase [Chloroflexota bacterium]